MWLPQNIPQDDKKLVCSSNYLRCHGIWILLRAQVVVPVRALRATTCKAWTKTYETNQIPFACSSGLFSLVLWQTNWGKKTCEGIHRAVHNSSCKALKYVGENVLAEEENDLLPQSCTAIQQSLLPTQQGVVSPQQSKQNSLSGRMDHHIKVTGLLGVLCESKKLFLVVSD